MKLTKRQLKKIIKEERHRLVREMNPDGTVSADEEEEREDLMMNVEMEIQNLIQFIAGEAERIGGSFRGPGIRKEALRLIADKIHGTR